MKRYDFNLELKSACSCEVTESPTGEYVKYEPWMDEVSRMAAKHNLNLDVESKLNDNINEPKDPTICVKCAYKIPTNYCRANPQPQYVYEKGKEMIDCRVKNHGNCPDYLLKE
jgi:hypothetical protein